MAKTRAWSTSRRVAVSGATGDPAVADRAASVLCRDSGFQPVELKLVRGQGVVWFVTERRPYRILITPSA